MSEDTNTDLDLDFEVGDVEESTGGPLPAGEYVLQITNVEKRTSQQGNPCLNVAFQVAEGDRTGAKLFDNVTLTVDWKVAQFLRSIYGRTVSGKKFNTADFLGKQVKALVAPEPDQQGIPRSRVRRYEPADESTAAAASPAPAEKKAATAKAAKPGSKAGDDDVSFG